MKTLICSNVDINNVVLASSSWGTVWQHCCRQTVTQLLPSLTTELQYGGKVRGQQSSTNISCLTISTYPIATVMFLTCKFNNLHVKNSSLCTKKPSYVPDLSSCKKWCEAFLIFEVFFAFLPFPLISDLTPCCTAVNIRQALTSSISSDMQSGPITA